MCECVCLHGFPVKCLCFHQDEHFTWLEFRVPRFCNVKPIETRVWLGKELVTREGAVPMSKSLQCARWTRPDWKENYNLRECNENGDAGARRCYIEWYHVTLDVWPSMKDNIQLPLTCTQVLWFFAELNSQALCLLWCDHMDVLYLTAAEYHTHPHPPHAHNPHSHVHSGSSVSVSLPQREWTSSVESMYRNLTSSMYDAQPSVWGALTPSSSSSLSLITPTPSHFLSLALAFSVIINKNTTLNLIFLIGNSVRTHERESEREE